jgi:hypothetical protein
MELLSEDFNPGLMCEQRAQIQTLDEDCLAINWNPETEKVVSSWKNGYLQFQDPNITVRTILQLLGYPVAFVEVQYGPLNAENLLDSTVHDMPLSQARLTEKTQTVEMQCFLEMLQEYEAGKDSVYENIVMMADDILFDEVGKPVWRNHSILADHDFHIIEEKPRWEEIAIQTKRGRIWM